MAQEPKYQKTMNLSLDTVQKIKELRAEYYTDTAVVTAGVALLYRTIEHKPQNEKKLRGIE